MKGRITPGDKIPPIAQDLVEVILQQEQSYTFAVQQVIEFSMNNNFQLFIKNVTLQPEIPSDKETLPEEIILPESEV